MNLVDELQKLEQLHQNGSLTAEEFSKAKTLLLSSLESASSSTDLATIRAFVDKEAQLKQLDLEWKAEQQQQIANGSTLLALVPLQLICTVIGGVIAAWFWVNELGQTQNIDLFFIFLLTLTILACIAMIWFLTRNMKQLNRNAATYRTSLQDYQTKRNQILRS